MRGHVRKRGSKWCIVVDLGKDPVTGKRKQKWYSGYKTKKEAEKDLADIITRIEKGQVADAKNMVLKEYLEMWLEDYAYHNVAPTTYESYVDAVRNVVSRLGNIKLSKLRPHHIQGFCSHLLKNSELSTTTIRYYYSVLNIALNTAIKWQLVPTNPCKGVTPPKKNQPKMTVLTEEQANQLLEGAKDTSLYLPVVLALTCGMRRGEILGLKWDDVDFDTKTIYVQRNLTMVKGKTSIRAPKTEQGKRSITMTKITARALKEEKKKQAQNKLTLGTRYKDNGFVCCWDDGTHYRPDYITHAFPKLLKKLELPKIPFHNLRHTHASLLLLKGVHPKVVQERLGHSSISITLDTYSHLMPSMQKEAAEKIDDVLGQK